MPEFISPWLLLGSCLGFPDVDIASGELPEHPPGLQAIPNANEMDAVHEPGLSGVSLSHVPGTDCPCDGVNNREASAGIPDPLGASPQLLADPLPGPQSEDAAPRRLRVARVLRSTGNAGVVSSVASRVTKRPKDDKKKAKTLRVRRCGACFRCSMYREEVGESSRIVMEKVLTVQCDEGGGVCSRCQKVLSRGMVSRWSACFRFDLNDCKVIRDSE